MAHANPRPEEFPTVKSRSTPAPAGTAQIDGARNRKPAAADIAAQRLQIALEGAQISVWETDLRTNEIWLDAAWARFLGETPGETRTNAAQLLGHVHPDDRAHVVAAAVAIQKGEIENYAEEHRVRTAQGGWRWILSRGRVIERDIGGRPLCVSGTNTDITERKQADENHRVQTERMRVGQSAARLIVMDWNVLNNEIGWSDSPEWLRGPLPRVGTYPPFIRQIPADDVARFFAARAKALETGMDQSIEFRFIRTDGQLLWIRSHYRVCAYAHDKPTRMLIALHDITDYKRAQERIDFLAHQDTLTALPNRVLFQDRMKQAAARALRECTKVAMLYLDLDNFKTINDCLGHAVGDGLLRAVATALLACVRESDTVSRHGSDEFVIMLPGLADADAVMPVLEKLTERFKLPFNAGSQALAISASIGVAVCPEDGVDFESLLKNADMAMHQAKESGKNTYRFHDGNLNVEAIEHLTLRNGLRAAIERREFVLHYQPQVDLTSGAVTGAEALVRWNHPRLGTIAPGRFVPIAEETGLIVPIGEWVLREACRQLAAWRKAGMRELVVTVNLSAAQFRRGDLEQIVVRALHDSGLEPAGLELELTESVLIRDAEATLATVRRLRALGVKFSIDDFGTGYSSLSYLKRFAVDKLKIDKSFIDDLASDREDAAIVRAVIQMANGLGLRTIAEGVEDESQMRHLLLNNCDAAQGYYFAPPLTAAAFADYVVLASPLRN